MTATATRSGDGWGRTPDRAAPALLCRELRRRQLALVRRGGDFPVRARGCRTARAARRNRSDRLQNASRDLVGVAQRVRPAILEISPVAAVDEAVRTLTDAPRSASP